MKPIRRVLAVLAGAALAAGGVVGCSDSKTTEEVAEPTAEESEVVEEEEEEEEIDEEAADQEIRDVAGGFVEDLTRMFGGLDPAPQEAFETADGDVEKFWDGLPMARYISFEGMTPEETYAFKNEFYELAEVGDMEFIIDAEVEVTFAEGAVTIDGDEAQVATAGGTITAVDEDGETLEESLDDMNWPEIQMVIDDGQWKVSAWGIVEEFEIAAVSDPESVEDPEEGTTEEE